MKTLLLALLALTLATSGLAATGMPLPAVVKARLNQGGPENLRAVQLGTQMVDKKVQLLKATYDFSVLGGAVSTVTLKDVDGKDATLPDNAVIKNVILDVLTAPTSGGLATVALGANTTTDLLGATAIASLTGLVAGVPVDAATAVKTTAQRNVTATIATAALTAGKIVVMIEYITSL